jgi:hypothetical protein
VLGQLGAGLDAFRRFFVQLLRNRRRSALVAQALDDQLSQHPPLAQPQPIAYAHLARRLHVLFIHLHPTQTDLFAGDRAGLKQARGPQPFVDANG